MCRVAAAAIAKKLLAEQGIQVLGYVKQIGTILAEIPDLEPGSPWNRWKPRPYAALIGRQPTK